MYRLSLYLILVFVLAACGSTEQTNVTPSPIAPSLSGNVDILTPQDGTTIYSELIFVTGNSSSLPDTGFRLVVMTADNQVIAQHHIAPSDGNWQVELVPDYRNPVEITIRAVSADDKIPGTYDVVTALFSSLEHRPDGTFGSITLPDAGSTIGGDTVEILGVASGLKDNTLVITLEAESGEEIDKRTITLTNPYFVNEVPWVAELNTRGQFGAARVRILGIDASTGEEIELDSVDVFLSIAAG